MRIALLGVRGSTPAPGADFARFGGHTSCVAVFTDGAAQPRLVLDAGTGIRDLPQLLGGAPFRGDLVLTHLHWDHVQGLPFCPSVDHPDARVRMFVPGAVDPAGARDLLARGMSPPFFPIAPEGLRGEWTFAAATIGRLPITVASVTVTAVEHKGGATIAIRVDSGDTSFAYLPDHALSDPPAAADSAAESLISGVSLLVHGGQFTRAEASAARDYGHATIEAAMSLADRCGVGRLLLTHHAPTRTDADLDRLVASTTCTPGGREVVFARQGDVLAV